MSRLVRTLLCLVLGMSLLSCLVACANDEDGQTGAETPAEETQQEAETETPDPGEGPLIDEQLYVNLIATGLDFSYGLTTDDGTLEVWQNEESYGVMRWSDPEQREIIVTRRFVEGEPEEWVYSDSGVLADAVTDVAPTGAQLQSYDALAEGIVTATTGAAGGLTRVYAWTSAEGQGIVAYSTKGVTDDPNLTINFGPDEQIARVDFTTP